MSSSNESNLLRHGVSPSKVGIPANTHLSAIEFLVQRFPAIQREVWLQRFLEGGILNAKGISIAPNQSVLHETHLRYFRHVADEPTLPFKAQIIFQDEHLIVADKPHFMPVTPGGQYVQQSLLIQLKQDFNLPELSPIHRIDRETAGLVMFSVRAKDRNAYQELFRLRQVQKTYEAIAGIPESSPLNPVFPITYKSVMANDAQFFKMRELTARECATTDQSNSETWIDCVEHLASQALARYILKPVTGQRHQLRVHMNALGLPIQGDRFYPHVKYLASEKDPLDQPLQLLAKTIAFLDPLTDTPRKFISGLKLAH
jgi:tRNA pseudouridine32 synthase/23S rRNA pseudouridine746 synthase